MDISLHRLGVDHLDICLCHDIEFVDMNRIVEETLPALRKVRDQGKVRFIGVSGYPLSIFRFILDRTDLDVILSYGHYTLQNRRLAELTPYSESKKVGVINASPFAARLLSSDPLPPWHKASALVKETCRQRRFFVKSTGRPLPSWPCNSLPAIPRSPAAWPGASIANNCASGRNGWPSRLTGVSWPKWNAFCPRRWTLATWKAGPRTTERRTAWDRQSDDWLFR